MAASSASDLESADYEALPSVDSVSKPKLLIFSCILVACAVTLVGCGLLFSPQLLSAGSFLYNPQDESNSIIFEHTAFHFQPDENWMNDPNGPLYYNGYYHLFYQYNPYSAVWGNITWGHAVSKDLLHWEQLELAMVPDQWYDADGVWSGSATVFPDGKIIMLYTGSTNESVQVQNMAVPKDYSDPLLREWIKAPFNPILQPPPGIGTKDFRDPTTAWLQEDGLWRIAIGAKKNTTGVGLIYQTSDFINWKLQDKFLREVPLTGMWECIDFFPIALSGKNGLDTSRVQVNSLVKYVIKVSLDDTRHDHYAIGTYDTDAGTWTPDDPVNDVGTGLRYDYGKFYASKTFFDPVKQRRILWGWANESDTEIDDLNKGWASIQTMPREVYLDTTTGSHLIQWPIEEVNTLRDKKIEARNDLLLEAGSVVEVKGAEGGQLDINVEFEYPDVSNVDVLPEETYECSQGGSAHRGMLGPFGLLVLAGKDLQEQTAVYFYLTLSSGGQWKTRVCSDQSRSSLESGIDKTVYGTVLPKLSGDDALSLRVIVDHSVVESYVQGGRTCITSRVYPTIAVGKDAHLFLFNNGTKAISMRSFEAWHMKSTKDTASITSLAVGSKRQIE